MIGSRRISLRHIAGVEAGMTWTFLVVLALFVVPLAAGVFPSTNPGLGTATYIAMGVVATVLFFGGGGNGSGEADLIVARLDPSRPVTEGGEIELWIDTSRLHLFDPDNGRSLTTPS